MGTIASEHRDDTSGKYSALPTSQQCPVIPRTALMMTHISNYEFNPYCASGAFLTLFFANMTIIQLRRIKSSLTQSDTPN
jgi:hypothetical protein